MRLLIRSIIFRHAKDVVMSNARSFGGLRKDQSVPTVTFIVWVLYSLFGQINFILRKDAPFAWVLASTWEFSPRLFLFVITIAVPVPVLLGLYCGDLGLKIGLAVMLCTIWLLCAVLAVVKKADGEDGRIQDWSGESPTLLEKLGTVGWVVRLVLLSSTIIVSETFNCALAERRLNIRLGSDYCSLDSIACTFGPSHWLDLRAYPAKSLDWHIDPASYVQA